MKQITFTGGATLDVDRIEIADGLGADTGAYVPEFTNAEGRFAVCVWGYCDSKHAYPTIKAAAAACRHRYPGFPIYRNGKIYSR